MEFPRLSEILDRFRKKRPTRDESGIALFMVISSMMVLSLLVTEFTYVVGVNQRMAYDGLDSLKAHYLAKSAFKISLLRLKAYQQLQSLAGSNPAGGGGSQQNSGGGLGGQIQIPRKLLDQIWSFPFFYPIPKNIPNMSLADKEKLEKFEQSSSLEGKFVATIQSDSGKFNLNSILPPLTAPTPTPVQDPNAPRRPTPTPAPGSTTVTAATPYDPQRARGSLRDFLANLIDRKAQSDDDFAREYRGYRIDDLMQQIITWADITYQDRGYPSNAEIQAKRAPFYSVSELHMIPELNDELYDLFAPNLTTGLTQGINVNTLTSELLAGLIPTMTQEEIDEFFKYRDDPEEDHQFKSTDDFFKYLADHVAVFKGSGASIDELKKSLAARGIQLLINESAFKITVQAQVGSANRIFEAWVILGGKPASPGAGTGGNLNGPQSTGFGSTNPGASAPTQATQQNSGLRVTFMRFL